MDIFCIHPMKTGMTSITRFLKQFTLNNKLDTKVFSAGHTTPQEMSWNNQQGIDYFKSKFCIQWSRNPYDRLVSFYFHMRQIGGHVNFLCRRASFKEFAMSKYIAQIVVPQIDYCFVDDIPIVSYFGRFEEHLFHSEKLFSIVLPDYLDRLKNEWSVAPRFFSTIHDNYQSYYDEETREYIHNKFKSDFEFFGYPEGL